MFNGIATKILRSKRDPIIDLLTRAIVAVSICLFAHYEYHCATKLLTENLFDAAINLELVFVSSVFKNQAVRLESYTPPGRLVSLQRDESRAPSGRLLPPAIPDTFRAAGLPACALRA